MHFIPLNPKVKRVSPDDPENVSPSLDVFGKPEGSDHNWRCSACQRMQQIGDKGLYINDAIRIGDSWPTILEVTRAAAWNGHFSKWCLHCAAKLLPEVPGETFSETVKRVLAKF